MNTKACSDDYFLNVSCVHANAWSLAFQAESHTISFGLDEILGEECT